MIKSIRTEINYYNFDKFVEFLEKHNLNEIRIGYYDRPNIYNLNHKFISYVYRDSYSPETIAELTNIMLKYGNIDNAYNAFITKTNRNS